MSNNPVFVGKTDFPLHASPSFFSGELGLWKTSDTLKNTPSFVVFDGPPYANGLPHLGHVLNKHLKDALARSHRLERNVSFRPGADCHGLPVELASLKENPQNPTYRLFAQSQVDGQRQVFMEQGWMMDWEKPWSTMDYDFEEHTLHSFQQMLENDHVFVAMSGTPWCGQCGSTLSLAEQEDNNHKGSQYLVPFFLDDDTCLLVWTTTAWSVPFHRALLVHPNTTYQAFLYQGKTCFVSSDTFDKWKEELQAEALDHRVLGSTFAGRGYQHGFGRGQVVADEEVLPEAGTGVLHCVPGLSELDTRLGEKNNWDLCSALDEQGVVVHSPCQHQVGRVFWDKEALTQVEKDVQCVWKKDYAQSVPHCWRHKTPVFYRPSRQVYLDLSRVAKTVENFVESTCFVPEASKSRMKSFLKGREKWCVSRQRKWGVPLALLVNEQGELLKQESLEFMNKARQVLLLGGVEQWRKQQMQFVPKGASLVDDVLDVWFDSGCVPSFLKSQGVACEGSDQHRGWFQSCMWVNALLGREQPFSMVLTHGFVVNSKGEKFAKSQGGGKGQSKEPWDKQNTDVVRLWALSGGMGSDKRWDDDTLSQAKQRLHKFRNTLRFLLANMPKSMPVSYSMDPDDAYFVWKTQQEVYTNMLLVQQGQFHEGMTNMQEWLDTLSKVAFQGWKDRLYCSYEGTKERASVEQAVWEVFSSVMVFVAVCCPRLFDEAKNKASHVYQADVCLDWYKLKTQAQVEHPQWLFMDEVLEKRWKVNLLVSQNQAEKTKNSLCLKTTLGYPLLSLRRLADYWDVGEVEVVEHSTMDADGFEFSQSRHEVCPRCRRPSLKTLTDHWCDTCEERRKEGE